MNTTVKVTNEEKYKKVIDVNAESVYTSDSGVCQGDLIILTDEGQYESFGEFLATEFEKEYGFILTNED